MRSLRRIWLTRLTRCSDYSGKHVKLPKILLNGNNICMARNPPIPITSAC